MRDSLAPFRTVAALYVESDGCYFGLPDVDPWDKHRDARLYDGPHPIVGHPPCERWGRMWFGSPLKPDREKYRLGDDGGCFEAALAAVRQWGGVIEHPEASKAWDRFNLNRPPRDGGWIAADLLGGWTCCVEQGHYGHRGRKLTWLYVVSCDLPDLKWGHSGQRLDPVLLERYGYLYARRCGITGMVGGKAKKKHRGATSEPFRDLLISIARTARESDERLCLRRAAAQPEGRQRGAAEERHSPNLSDRHPPGSSPTDTTGDDVQNLLHGASNG